MRWVAGALMLLGLAAGWACSTSPKLVGAGGQCFQATDCQDGLVCIPLSNGGRVCSADLTSVQKVPEPPDNGDAADDGPTDDGPLDGPPPGDGPGDTGPPPDNFVPPDTFVPPPDTGAG